MIANRRPRTFTVDEYVDLEHRSDTKNELIDGTIFAMTGGTPRHAQLCLHVGAFLRASLRGKVCKPYGTELHLFIPKANRGTYADASVFCTPLEYHGKRTDVVTNPTLVVEVLSPSTERDDRGDKLVAYQMLDSLREVVLVAQDRPHVEVLTREGAVWMPRAHDGMGAVARLASIDVEMPLRELYDGVDFDAPE